MRHKSNFRKGCFFMKDYYTILGVSKNATTDQIKRAYRRLAKQYHPDVNPSPEAHQIFIEIQEAYEVLSDPIRRQQYDQIFVHSYEQTSYSQTYHRPRASYRPGRDKLMTYYIAFLGIFIYSLFLLSSDKRSDFWIGLGVLGFIIGLLGTTILGFVLYFRRRFVIGLIISILLSLFVLFILLILLIFG